MSNFTPVHLSFDITTRIVSSNGRNLKLTPLEADVLQYVMERSGVFIPIVELIVNVWGDHPDSSKGSYDEIIRHLIRRIKNELEFPDKLLVYSRKRLICRLEPDVAAQVMITGKANVIPGPLSPEPAKISAPTAISTERLELPYTVTHRVIIGLMGSIFYYKARDIFWPGSPFRREEEAMRTKAPSLSFGGFLDRVIAINALDALFISWYNTVAQSMGVPSPHNAFEEGRFGPWHLGVSNEDWHIFLACSITTLLNHFPGEMQDWGSVSDAGAVLRRSIFERLEFWRPVAALELPQSYFFVRSPVALQEGLYSDPEWKEIWNEEGVEDKPYIPNPIIPPSLRLNP